jgi:hypothetical protein
VVVPSILATFVISVDITFSRSVEIGTRRKIDKGSFPLCLGKEDIKRVLLSFQKQANGELNS